MDQKKYCKEIFWKIDKIWLDTFDYILFIKKPPKNVHSLDASFVKIIQLFYIELFRGISNKNLCIRFLFQMSLNHLNKN